MGKRGPKPGHKTSRQISEQWSPELAYAIGLIATDGCIAKRTSLIDLTSKDEEQLLNFNRALGVDHRITKKLSGTKNRTCLRIQFKNVLFYNFLLSIGITPAKSKTIGELKIPEQYFFDFLRGAFDGDGSTYSYWDPRWRSSFMFYLGFASASPAFIAWIRNSINRELGILGHVTKQKKMAGGCYQLKYAKKEGLKVLKKMYHRYDVICLSRKRLKINKMLRTIGQRL